MTNLQSLSQQEIDFILERGVLAPSADNLQPWKFKIFQPSAGTGIFLYLDPDRLKNFCDTALLMPYASAGAVIENIRIASQHLGYEINLHYFPKSEDINCVAQIAFLKSQTKGHPFEEWLKIRITNRNFYEPKHIIQESFYKSCRETVKKNSGFDLFWVKGDDKRFSELSAIIGQSDQIRFENKRLHKELFEVMRLDKDALNKRRDGLDIRSLDAGPGSSFLFKWIASWPRLQMMNYLGLSRIFNLYAKLQTQSSQALGLLTAPTQNPKDYVLGGELMERIWLMAAANEIAMQPMEALPIFILNLQQNHSENFSPAHLNQLKTLKDKFFTLFRINDQNGLILLFRIGYAKKLASAHSPRRPLSEFLVPTSEKSVSF